jgi:hypothetical protein
MFSYDDAEKGLRSAGLSSDVSRLYVEMSKAMNGGRIAGITRTQQNTTPTSFEQFCDETLVPIYSQKKAA